MCAMTCYTDARCCLATCSQCNCDHLLHGRCPDPAENFEGPQTCILALRPGWCAPLGASPTGLRLPSWPGFPPSLPSTQAIPSTRDGGLGPIPSGRLPGTVSHFAGTPRPDAAVVARPTFPGSMAASRPGYAVKAARLPPSDQPTRARTRLRSTWWPSMPCGRYSAPARPRLLATRGARRTPEPSRCLLSNRSATTGSSRPPPSHGHPLRLRVAAS